MALEKYNEKRNFKITPEPPGKHKNLKSRKSEKGGLHYYIQKHAASHLHFDFRLEHYGVLKSWAVPKGPSLFPRTKRLAMEVEDHPLEYGQFEGIIPKGEYGGGTVMLWDQGIWIPDDDPGLSLKKGKLGFQLKGKRLKGHWTLIRSHQENKSKPMWFLIGKGAGKNEPAEEVLTSVKSGRTMEEIALQKKSKVWHSDKATKPTEHPLISKDTPIFHLPKDFRPQLATLVDRAPEGNEWIHEVKFDGYRILAMIKKGHVRLFSRNGLDWTDRLKNIADAVGTLDFKDGLLDGEVIVPDHNGRSDFQALQNAFKEGKKAKFIYYVFDLPFLKGRDLRDKPLFRRKEALAKLLSSQQKHSLIQFSAHLEGAGSQVFEQACELGLEGIISKKRESPYVGHRGTSWVKIKCSLRQEFIIVGYSAPQGGRSHFGALLLGAHNKAGRLQYVGKTGTGFNQTRLTEIKTVLDRLKFKRPKLEDPSAELSHFKTVTWVKPKLVAEIKFSAWTKDQLLRQAVFVGLRPDKAAREVTLEKPQNVESVERKKDRKSNEPKKSIEISKRDKILFTPDITKGELAQYYEQVCDYILPFIRNRPLALVRCPNGHMGNCFFQKHQMSSKVGGQHIKTGNRGEFIYIEDLKGLLSLVQMGVLEIHGWGAKVDDFEKPDQIVFDLDKDESVEWPQVLLTAKRLRDRLKRLKLKSFVKTTGGKGLHIVIPIIPEKNWEEVKNFSKVIAETLVTEFPDQYTSNMSKAKRPGKIFIDYLRNGRGATSIAPFSTRAKSGAPVAAPLSWNELDQVASADQFTLRNIFQRLRTVKDSWADFFKIKQLLPNLSLLP